MNRTRWIIFGVIVVAIFALLIFTNKSSESTFTGDVNKIITEGPIPDRVYGSDEQKVVLIEYGDFQCPACLSIYPSVKQIKELYKDKLTFIFRELPLTNVHPNALAAATAAEAAGQQGKFFDMFNKLYDNQSAWSTASVDDRGKLFEQYAGELGLSMDQFKQDLSNPEITKKIERDRTTAKGFGATATPTFVLDGQKLPESTSTNGPELKKAVEEALQNAGYKLDKAK